MFFFKKKSQEIDLVEDYTTQICNQLKGVENYIDSEFPTGFEVACCLANAAVALMRAKNKPVDKFIAQSIDLFREKYGVDVNTHAKEFNIRSQIYTSLIIGQYKPSTVWFLGNGLNKDNHFINSFFALGDILVCPACAEDEKSYPDNFPVRLIGFEAMAEFAAVYAGAVKIFQEFVKKCYA